MSSSRAPEPSSPASLFETDEREALVRSSRLHWVHWLIVGSSLVLTICAWYFSKTQVEAAVENRFDRESSRMLELIQERMELYANALNSGVAAIRMRGEEISLSEWQRFSDTLRIERRYPGINGIGVIDRVPGEDRSGYLARVREEIPGFSIHPAHERPDLWPIRLIEPIATNAAAVGLDMAHETNRRTGVELARDLGRPQITGPIVLVQDEKKTPGFLFFSPFYDGEANALTVAERREKIRGFVYSPFIVSNLLQGALRKESRQVSIRILDGEDIIYDEQVAGEPDYDPHPIHASRTSADFYGRTWHFDIATTKSFRGATRSDQPALILVGGILIDALLLALFIAFSRSNRRAMEFADRATTELWRRTEELERSNEALEKFAYVASHDLKTPLRGISDLASYLEEDLEDYLADATSNADVKKNLERLGVQVARMDGLIKGILDYSSLGQADAVRGEIDLAEVVGSTMRDLGCDADRWDLVGAPRRVEADEVRLTQIVTNLVSNAVKHHDNPDRLYVHVEICENAGRYRLSISDNGPGIAERYRARIFEAFQTLQSKDVLDSTGIGLAIVKKTVDLMDGAIFVESSPEGGSTFVVEWPK